MTASRAAVVVVDLGFGDAGKGTLVDWLVRTRGARTVVRFHGGAQAGHNVVTDDGRHHTFSQFGAGSFVAGVRTHLTGDVVLHPLAMSVEARHLAAKGVSDAMARTTVSERARVITPFHQSVGRLRELARGAARHGTCGVGVGETVRDALAHPDEVITARDLGDSFVVRTKSARAQERMREEARGLGDDPDERALLDDPEVPARWSEAVRASFGARVVDDGHLRALLREGTTVFEGAQGVLLDEWWGFHPHTTWSTCTFERALAAMEAHGYDGDVTRLGVLRTYATRHGEGPLPTEDSSLRAAWHEPHNGGGWQGAFRVGCFDAVLARYALTVCGGVDALALTHCDRLTPRWMVCNTYDPPVSLVPGARGDLAHQASLTRALRAVTPVRTTLDLGGDPTEAMARWVESALGARVGVVSSGPCARDKRVR